MLASSEAMAGVGGLVSSFVVGRALLNTEHEPSRPGLGLEAFTRFVGPGCCGRGGEGLWWRGFFTT